MKLAAAEAIASVVPRRELSPDYIVPSVFDRRVAEAVARAVARMALRTGVARRRRRSDDVAGDQVARRRGPTM
jgi:malate dehydrogenase (oxaloacetate-decarboxylating)